MKSVNDILSEFKLDQSTIDRLSAETRELSNECGKKGVIKNLSSETWDLLDDISEQVWQSKDSWSVKIKLGFELFELFPSYYHFLVPFYRCLRDGELTDQQDCNSIWQHFMHFLSRENYYSDPIGYVLWVEFFEDQSTVEKTWRGLMQFRENRTAVRKLLEYIGPVPFEWKKTLYLELLPDKDFHEIVLTSLLYSAYDLFGSVSFTGARSILRKLVIDRSSDNYKLLVKKLSQK